MMSLTAKYHFEKWLPAPGFPDYAVSNFGRVKRVTAGANNFCKPGRVLRLAQEKNGYIRVGLHIDGKVKRVSVHRLVALAFIGPPPTEKHEVAHNDGNRHFNVEDNLRWSTRSENHADKILHGTAQRGHKNGNSRITKRQAEFIRESKHSGIELADVFGVCKGTIYRIRTRKVHNADLDDEVTF